MKKLIIFATLVAATGFGCARLNVGGAKEPIKVDISMRLDIYQHVQKDIDSIENIVSGDKSQPAKKPDGRSFLNYLIGNAYAQESLSPEVEQAALRRKDRKATLSSWEAQAVVGENRSALVEIRNPEVADSAVVEMVRSENEDRMIIYRALAKKYGQTLEEIQRTYAEKLASQAPAGTPVETFNILKGYSEWKIK